jgi:hypothetical protein
MLGPLQYNGGAPPTLARVVYGATRAQWIGTLTIAGAAFTGSASALFTLLTRLDRQYRHYLGAAATGDAAETGP